MIDAALRQTGEEAEWLRCDRQAMANHVYRGPYALFRHWKDHDNYSDDNSDNDGADGNRGPTGQGGHAYEVTIQYLA